MEIKNSISAVSHIHSLAADFLEKKLKAQGFKNFASSHGNILFQLSINGQMMMGELSKAINRNKSTINNATMIFTLFSLNNIYILYFFRFLTFPILLFRPIISLLTTNYETFSLIILYK